jgi:hypothetical protein
MALNFPSNPLLNAEYTSGNSTWTWDGTAWNVTFSSATSQVNAFGIISTSGQPSIIADSTSDVLNLIAGNNISISTNPASDSITVNANLNLSNVFTIAADDSAQRPISQGETVQFIGGAGINTATDADGNITISNSFASATAFVNLAEADVANLTIDQIYEPAIATLRVDNVGTTAYTFNSHYSGNNPTIYALGGTTLAFHLAAIPGLPFEIQDPTGVPYNTGLVHVATNGTVSTGAAAQDKDSGTLYWRVPETISGNYRYQCASFAPMVGAITVKRLSTI